MQRKRERERVNNLMQLFGGFSKRWSVELWFFEGNY